MRNYFRNVHRVHRFILCLNYMMFPLVPPPSLLMHCVAIFAVAEVWLFLDIGWFVLLLNFVPEPRRWQSLRKVSCYLYLLIPCIPQISLSILQLCTKYESRIILKTIQITCWNKNVDKVHLWPRHLAFWSNDVNILHLCMYMKALR